MVVPECIIDCGTVVVDSGTVVVARGVGGTVVVPTLRGYRVVGTPLGEDVLVVSGARDVGTTCGFVVEVLVGGRTGTVVPVDARVATVVLVVGLLVVVAAGPVVVVTARSSVVGVSGFSVVEGAVEGGEGCVVMLLAMDVVVPAEVVVTM